MVRINTNVVIEDQAQDGGKLGVNLELSEHSWTRKSSEPLLNIALRGGDRANYWKREKNRIRRVPFAHTSCVGLLPAGVAVANFSPGIGPMLSTS